MKRVGDFWVPDVDLRRFSKWGKQRRKTLQYYGSGRGAKAEDLEEALALVGRGRVALDGGANVGAYTRLLDPREWRRLDFLEFSKHANPSLERYPFTPDAVLSKLR